MKIIDRVLGSIGLERRSASTGWGAFAPFMPDRPIGRPESISAVYACVGAISETIATLPLMVYQRKGEERERAAGHALYRLLHDAPNDWQTALEFREQLQASVLLRGNGYAEVVRGLNGEISALVPLHADRVTVLRLENGRLSYEVTTIEGQKRRLLQDEVFHLRHRTDDGILGVSPITAAREVIELALAERDHGNSTFRNGARLSGVLKMPGKLSEPQRKNLKDSWNSQYSGGANHGKTAVLEEGMEYQAVSMTLEDAEWIAARQFSVEEVARLFRVPPTIVGDLRHGNYSNSVEMSRQFVTLTLRRHLTMWEQSINRTLLGGSDTYFAEHSLEGLLRGDSTNRAEFYSKGIKDGWLAPDEVRQLENLPKRAINAPSDQTTQAANA